MAELYLAHYLPGDEAAFTPRPDMAEELAALGWDWAQGPPGPTWTLMRRSGEILGLGGFVPHGAALEAWSLLAPLRLRDWPRVLELARLRLGGQAAAAVLARCRMADAGAQRVLGRLGFAPGDPEQDARLPDVEIQRMWRFC